MAAGQTAVLDYFTTWPYFHEEYTVAGHICKDGSNVDTTQISCYKQATLDSRNWGEGEN